MTMTEELDQLDESLIVTQDEENDEDEYSASTDSNTEENEEGATAPAPPLFGLHTGEPSDYDDNSSDEDWHELLEMFEMEYDEKEPEQSTTEEKMNIQELFSEDEQLKPGPSGLN